MMSKSGKQLKNKPSKQHRPMWLQQKKTSQQHCKPGKEMPVLLKTFQ